MEKLLYFGGGALAVLWARRRARQMRFYDEAERLFGPRKNWPPAVRQRVEALWASRDEPLVPRLRLPWGD
jgi:hypothetical protein